METLIAELSLVISTQCRYIIVNEDLTSVTDCRVIILRVISKVCVIDCAMCQVLFSAWEEP